MSSAWRYTEGIMVFHHGNFCLIEIRELPVGLGFHWDSEGRGGWIRRQKGQGVPSSLWKGKAKAIVAQSCPTLCDPTDCSPPGFSVHGILQARILGWVAIPFSRGSSWLSDRTWVSHTAGKFFTIWVTRETLLSLWEWMFLHTKELSKSE